MQCIRHTPKHNQQLLNVYFGGCCSGVHNTKSKNRLKACEFFQWWTANTRVENPRNYRRCVVCALSKGQHATKSRIKGKTSEGRTFESTTQHRSRCDASWSVERWLSMWSVPLYVAAAFCLSIDGFCSAMRVNSQQSQSREDF